MTAQLKKIINTYMFGFVVIFFACVVMEQSAEFDASKKTINELRLLMSLKKVSLKDYFDSIEMELKSAAADDEIQESMAKLNAIWYQLTAEERKQLHELFQTERNANQVKQAYLLANKQKDTQLYNKHLKNNNQQNTAASITQSDSNAASVWSSAYDTSSHLRSMISPEMQDYLDYFSKFQVYGEKFMEHFEYYDVFLITPNGDVVYSYKLEDDFATNLGKGPYAKTDLAYAFYSAMQQKGTKLQYSAFKPYQASDNIRSSFTAFPIYNGKELVGVVALQFSADMVTTAIQHNAGIDNDVATYLVDHNHVVLTQVTASKLNEHKARKAIGHQHSTTRFDRNVKLAFSGKQGVNKVNNYKGQFVFSAFTPFTIKNNRWAILAEKPVAMVLNHIRLWWLIACMVSLCIYWMIYFALTHIDGRLNKPLQITTYEGAP